MLEEMIDECKKVHYSIAIGIPRSCLRRRKFGACAHTYRSTYNLSIIIRNVCDGGHTDQDGRSLSNKPVVDHGGCRKLIMSSTEESKTSTTITFTISLCLVMRVSERRIMLL